MFFCKYLLINKSSKVIFSSIIAVIFLLSYPAKALAMFNSFTKWAAGVVGVEQDVGGIVGGRGKGGGGRGNCPVDTAENDKQLIALIPPLEGETNEPSSKTDKSSSKNDKPSSKVVFSHTIEEKPNLWFYIPYEYNEKSQLQYAKLAIIDEEKRLVTEPMILRLPDDASIAQVKLPINLEVNKKYQWFFSIVCDEKKPSRNPSVSGWIKRIPPDEVNVPPQPSNENFPLFDYRKFAASGLWFNGFTRLAEVYQSRILSNNPQFSDHKIQEDWVEVVKELLWDDKGNKNNEEIAKEILQIPILELDVDYSQFE